MPPESSERRGDGGRCWSPRLCLSRVSYLDMINVRYLVARTDMVPDRAHVLPMNGRTWCGWSPGLRHGLARSSPLACRGTAVRRAWLRCCGRRGDLFRQLTSKMCQPWRPWPPCQPPGQWSQPPTIVLTPNSTSFKYERPAWARGSLGGVCRARLPGHTERRIRPVLAGESRTQGRLRAGCWRLDRALCLPPAALDPIVDRGRPRPRWVPRTAAGKAFAQITFASPGGLSRCAALGRPGVRGSQKGNHAQGVASFGSWCGPGHRCGHQCVRTALDHVSRNGPGVQGRARLRHRRSSGPLGLLEPRRRQPQSRRVRGLGHEPGQPLERQRHWPDVHQHGHWAGSSGRPPATTS